MTFTQHLNQMKLSAFVTIAAVIGGSFLIPIPATGSVIVNLDKRYVSESNDGNPVIYVRGGGHTSRDFSESAKYPNPGMPFNHTVRTKLSDNWARKWAKEHYKTMN